MSKHKYIDRICIVFTVIALILAVLFMCKGVLGYKSYVKEMGYENRLFDTSKVHSIEIKMDDWDSFIENCQDEEYQICDLVIDNEVYKNVAIRGKGNTSLSSVAAMGSERYSFKVEFDQYNDGGSYHGLDKLSLNNLIQDNTYMKDYLTYQMMNEFGVDSPLCSFVYITVNGEEWGLYLAVEGVEDAFLQRNYGTNYGELYKPDSMNFGAGRGNGKDFDFPEGGFSMGGSDVKLQYIDNNVESYSNIFDNAKTDVSTADKERLINSLQILSEGKKIERVVDIDEVIRYFVVHNFVCNGDSYTGMMVHNYYLYEKSGKLSMIPWDYNLAYGTFQSTNATSQINSPIDDPVSNSSGNDRPMIDWMLNSQSYTEVYHQYFAEFLNTVDYVSIIENAEKLIDPYVEKDPTKFCTYDEFLDAVKTIKEFCILRGESVQGQLDGEIPSTLAGQKEENVMLVDASHVNIAAMGTMGGNMGFGGRGERPEGEKGERPDMSQMSEMPEDFDMSQMPEMPEGFDMSQMPNMEEFEGRFEFGQFSDSMMPDRGFGTGMNESLSDIIWILVSIVVLIVGMIVAYKFKGKNE